MPATPEDVTEEDTKKRQLEQIQTIVKRIKRENPVPIKINNETQVSINGDLLERLGSGKGFYKIDWEILGQLFVTKRQPKIVFLVGGLAETLTLEPDGTCLWLSLSFKSCLRNTPSWFICSFRSFSPELRIYSVGEIYGHTYSLMRQQVSKMLNIEAHRMIIILHQELPLTGETREPYEDAILFDMLLDLALGNFKGHQRHINDGPHITMEILEALEQEQLAADSAARIGPEKRRLTILDKVNGKRFKSE